MSLLTLYIEGVSTKFHLGKTTRASMHNVYIQQTVQSGGSGGNHKKGGIMKGTRALLAHLSSQSRPDNVQGEPILIETSEKQLEELVVTLDVGRAHTQLRRLKTESTIGQECPVMVTAIPEHRSKVLFECLKMIDNIGVDNSIGYIMFECGLEGVSVKIVKRSHFEKSENSKEELANIAEEARTLATGTLINEDSNLLTGVLPLDNTTANVTTSSRAEAAWRLLTKKPTTPRTPKESLQNPLESVIIESRPEMMGSAGVGIGLGEARKSHLKPVEEENEKTAGGRQNGVKKSDSSVTGDQKDMDKTSSCVIDLKSVWFNFAAPPCVPITRKIDLTRLDWNLLSTASPAITAWMNSSNRLAIKVVALLKALHFRQTAATACLMADALENEKIQRNPKIKKVFLLSFSPFLLHLSFSYWLLRLFFRVAM